jgi:DNA-binding beta-propeller fold protein YncE
MCILSTGTVSAQFVYRMDSPLGRDAFRTGVEAYHRGRYAESLLSFEKALVDAPQDALGLYWLGKAYYRLGLFTTAIDRWQDALDSGGQSPFVESRIELADGMYAPMRASLASRYVRVAEVTGRTAQSTRFNRPSWIEPRPDGSIILVSHGTNELLFIDANGQIIQRIQGGSSGFDRPFACVVLPDGSLFLSEFQADRIVRLSPEGRIIGYAEPRSGANRLSGPQYLAVDNNGFVYVSDAGTGRIIKYSSDGSWILSFGERTPVFDGLKLPTGIAVRDQKIYVADAFMKIISIFDLYGNYLGQVPSSRFERPEGIRAIPEGLLVADGSRVILLDPESGSIRELLRSERRNPHIVSAAFDANGDLLFVDFDASELVYSSDPQTRYAGLSVEVLRVYSDNFPRISLDVVVNDRAGKPVTGLGAANFYIAERVLRTERRVEGEKTVDVVMESIRPATGFGFGGSLDASSRIDSIVLVEGSPAMQAMRLEARDVLSDFHASLGSDASAGLILAGTSAQPAVTSGLGPMTAALLNLQGSNSWRFDTGLRLAAGSLGLSSGRRAVIFLTTGSTNETLIQESSLAELASLMGANGISFHAIVIGRGEVSAVVEYLATASGGSVVKASRPEGLGTIARDIRKAATGRYRLSFISSANDGFGRTYLPFSLEAYLRDRSGKDETGYFAPLR